MGLLSRASHRTTPSFEIRGKEALKERIGKLTPRKSTPYTALSLIKAAGAFETGICLSLEDGFYSSYTSVGMGIGKVSIPLEKIWSAENTGKKYLAPENGKNLDIKNCPDGLKFWIFPLDFSEPDKPWGGIMIAGVPDAAFDPMPLADLLSSVAHKLYMKPGQETQEVSPGIPPEESLADTATFGELPAGNIASGESAEDAAIPETVSIDDTAPGESISGGSVSEEVPRDDIFPETVPLGETPLEEPFINETDNDEPSPDNSFFEEVPVENITSAETPLDETISEAEFAGEDNPGEPLPELIVPEEPMPGETTPVENSANDFISETFPLDETIPETNTAGEAEPETSVPGEAGIEEFSVDEILPEEILPEEPLSGESPAEEKNPEEPPPDEIIIEEISIDEIAPEEISAGDSSSETFPPDEPNLNEIPIGETVPEELALDAITPEENLTEAINSEEAAAGEAEPEAFTVIDFGEPVPEEFVLPEARIDEAEDNQDAYFPEAATGETEDNTDSCSPEALVPEKTKLLEEAIAQFDGAPNGFNCVVYQSENASFRDDLSALIDKIGMVLPFPESYAIILLPKAADRELIAHRLSAYLNTSELLSFEAASVADAVERINSLP